MIFARAVDLGAVPRKEEQEALFQKKWQFRLPVWPPVTLLTDRHSF